MKNIHLSELISILNSFVIDHSNLIHDPLISRVQFDSRQVLPGDLFVATIGARANGHDYVQQAKEKGAVATLISQDITIDIPYIKVLDTTEALGALGNHVRSQFSIPVIGVTGSSGKTTVKTMIASILEQAYGTKHYFATQKNYNTKITIPIGLLDLAENHQAAVVEMGMTHIGDLISSSAIVRPTVAAITNISNVHVACSGSIENIMRGKAQIFSGLSVDGIAILNRDDIYFEELKKFAHPHKIITFGTHLKSDICIQKSTFDFKVTQVELFFAELQKTITFTLPLAGAHNAMNAACAAACTYAIDVSPDIIKQGLEQMIGPERRLQHFTGKQGCLIIDDGYNANPRAVKAVVEVLKQYPGKKIVLLGDMRELGPDELKFHAEIGEYIQSSGIDYLFAVGNLTKEAVKHFGNHGYFIENRSEVISTILPFLDANTCILIKGSFSMNMKEFVDGFSEK